MPRNPGLVYLYYNDLGIVPPFKQPRVQCKYCPHTCNKALNKCESHLKNCAKIDNETYQSYFANEQDSLELEFAEAVFQCGLPFSFCELVPILAWIKKIKPLFKLPTRNKYLIN
ncbi:44680_t:CDS:2 [Gigaspora margarita]|uniref:44680_t:CDS:1 n=1 Tax=Gigaspora margarita TaxID=4874 RepID=A0ABN7V502_GIGMA|nr:44680_t:CDS:2 [Gigaspora margarita]